MGRRVRYRMTISNSFWGEGIRRENEEVAKRTCMTVRDKTRRGDERWDGRTHEGNKDGRRSGRGCSVLRIVPEPFLKCLGLYCTVWLFYRQFCALFYIGSVIFFPHTPVDCVQYSIRSYFCSWLSRRLNDMAFVLCLAALSWCTWFSEGMSLSLHAACRTSIV